MGRRRGEGGHQRAIKSVQEPSSLICKNNEKLKVFYGFLDTDASQERLRKPREAPKRLADLQREAFKQRAPK